MQGLNAAEHQMFTGCSLQQVVDSQNNLQQIIILFLFVHYKKEPTEYFSKQQSRGASQTPYSKKKIRDVAKKHIILSFLC